MPIPALPSSATSIPFEIVQSSGSPSTPPHDKDGPSPADLRLPVLLEHDRGFERERQFKQKIAAYRAYLNSGAYKEQFGISNITIIVTTFTDMQRVADLRQWTWDELRALSP